MTDEQKLDFLYGELGNVNCIRRELHNTSENAVAIGFYLDEIKRLEYWTASQFYKNFKPKIIGLKGEAYKYDSYTFYDYCRDEFNFSRRTVDRYIDIYYSFSSVNCSGARTKFIDKKYKDYNCSQLAEMLGLSDKKKDLVNPGMTVREIRNLKKNDIVIPDKNDNVNEMQLPADEAAPANNNNDVVTFVNKNNLDSIAPDDVNIVFDKDFEDKTFKKKKYHVSGNLFDKFVSTSSQYTQQFVKLQDYLNKGYLVRIVLYAPEDEEGGKAANE